jgi:hypothetical protein
MGDAMTSANRRPFGITVLVSLFAIGVCASLISAVSLSFPGSFLETVWRLNPRAREGFNHLGGWAILLMISVCIACALTVMGLWRGRLWGYWLALAMLLLNVAGDFINVISGSEPKAIVGIPVVLAIVVYLLRNRTRQYFKSTPRVY